MERGEHRGEDSSELFCPLAPRDTCPSCVDESAYIFWQLWAKGFVKRNHSYCFDWSPLVMLGAQNAFKCDCATASEDKARTYRTSKKGHVCFLFTEGTIIWHFGALSGLSPTLERTALSVIAGSGLGGRPKALDNWAHGAWHSSWLVTTDANQSVSGLPATVWLEDFCSVGVMCSCSGCLSAFPPAGPGHQANHWHKTLDAGETRKKWRRLTIKHMKNKSEPAC